MSQDVTTPVETPAPDAAHAPAEERAEAPPVAPEPAGPGAPLLFDEPTVENGRHATQEQPEAAEAVRQEEEAPRHEEASAGADAAPQEESAIEEEAAEEEAAEEEPGGDEEVAEAEARDEEPAADEEQQPEKHWYVVKVQSGREDTIKDAIERRVRKEGLEEFFGQIVIPVEKVTEVKVDKNGKRVPKTKERKLYPGYLMVEVSYNDRIVYLFRETSGVGDFVGAHPGDLMKPPTPMSEREVQRMLGPGHKAAGPGDTGAAPAASVPKWLQPGERVRVVDGTFNGMDGSVKQILEAVSKVQVELSIFGRPVAVDFEYYQVEPA